MLSGHIHLDGAGDLLWPRILLDHVDGAEEAELVGAVVEDEALVALAAAHGRSRTRWRNWRWQCGGAVTEASFHTTLK